MLSGDELGVVQHLYICAMLRRKPNKEFQFKSERLIQKQLVARGAAFSKDYDLPTWYRTLDQLKRRK